MKGRIELPITELANAAFRKAAQTVIKRAIASGTPIIVWEDGEIKKIWPDDPSLKDLYPQKEKKIGDPQ